jgi:hypothetical protein
VRKRFLWPNVAREYLTLYLSLVPSTAAALAVVEEQAPALAAIA